jgi:hypothetical protein
MKRNIYGSFAHFLHFHLRFDERMNGKKKERETTKNFNIAEVIRICILLNQLNFFVSMKALTVGVHNQNYSHNCRLEIFLMINHEYFSFCSQLDKILNMFINFYFGLYLHVAIPRAGNIGKILRAS